MADEIDKNIRQSIIWELESFADGSERVRRAGFAEYFEAFYDFVPSGSQQNKLEYPAMSPVELDAVMMVRSLVDEAYAATPLEMDDDEFIATGWPDNIAVVAQAALEVFNAN